MDEFSLVIEHLFSQHIMGKASLDHMRKLSVYLGSPEKAFPAVHVAGSNGKGSVCLKVAKALEYAGYKVGLYTSPHLHCYTERIQVSSIPISKVEVVEGLQRLFALASQLDINPTFFELTTLLSMMYFQKEKIDVAVVETGLGGRLDATRVVHPILSIITSISLEHTQLLGDTIEEIGREKAGICKSGVPLIIGPKAKVSSILETANVLECSVIEAEEVRGFYDEENQQIAKKASEELKKHFSKLTDEAIEKALLERPQCRMEICGSVVFDVAHNQDAFQRVFAEVKKRYPDKSLRSIIGLSSDKDVKECLKIAAGCSQQICLVQADGIRPAKKEHMARMLDDLGYTNYTLEESISKAVLTALEIEDSITVVCGSFYIMDEAKKALFAIR